MTGITVRSEQDQSCLAVGRGWAIRFVLNAVPAQDILAGVVKANQLGFNTPLAEFQHHPVKRANA